VRIEGLSKAYGLSWALRAIDLQLEEGECVVLLGPNGAGKTTLLKLLSALTYPTEGRIEVAGQELCYGNSPLRCKIGFLSTDAHLYSDLTVTENLRFFLSLYQGNAAKDRIAQAVHAVGLTPWASEYVSALSHGMRSRLAIAKWSLLEPRLLLLDEPYGALDASGIEVLETFVKSTCAAGGLVIIATHNVSRGIALCSRAIILHRGQILFNEPRQEPWDSFYRAFADFSPREAPSS
jgi:heme ABC exporter ATP-binding subunit CcmA